MKESPNSGALETRSLLWPAVLALAGGMNVLAFLDALTFDTAALLKGAGFLLMVPFTWLYPRDSTFKRQTPRSGAAAWAGWLAFFGIMLLFVGFSIVVARFVMR